MKRNNLLLSPLKTYDDDINALNTYFNNIEYSTNIEYINSISTRLKSSGNINGIYEYIDEVHNKVGNIKAENQLRYNEAKRLIKALHAGEDIFIDLLKIRDIYAHIYNI